MSMRFFAIHGQTRRRKRVELRLLHPAMGCAASGGMGGRLQRASQFERTPTQRSVVVVRRLPALVSAVVLAGLLAGCAGSSAPVGELRPPAAIATPQATPSVATPAAATAPAAALGEIVWAEALDPDTGAPLAVAPAFLPDAPRLTAATLATNVPQGAAIEAVWTYNDTSLDAFATRLTLDETAPRRWLTFHLDRDPQTPWPVGAYAVEISLDGVVTQRAAVEVRADG